MKIILLPIIMLGLALFSMPYGYYQFLRIVVCGISGLIAYGLCAKENKNWLFWGYIAIAIIYNPIAKITFAKDVWVFLNIITIIYYLGTYKLINEKIKKLF